MDSRDPESGQKLKERATKVAGVRQYAYQAVARAYEVIPRALAHNCGGDVVRIMTDLRSRHATEKPSNMGLDGITGKLHWDSVVVLLHCLFRAALAAHFFRRACSTARLAN